MKNRRQKSRLLVPFLQVLGDAVAVVGAFLFSYWLRFASPLTRMVPVTKGFPGLNMYVISSVVVFLVWVFVFRSIGMYGPRRNVGSVDELASIFKGVTLGMLLVTAATFFYRGFSYSRMVFVLIWATSILFLFLVRVLVMKFEVRLHRKGKNLLNCLIVGSSRWSPILLDQVRQHPGFGMDILGYVGQNPHLRKKLVCLGNLGLIRKLVDKHEIDVVFVALAEKETTLLEDCIQACAGMNIEFLMIPHSLELMSSRIRVQEIGGVPVLRIKEAAITGWNAVFKRIFDVGFASVVLLLAWPIFLVTAAVVKLGSSGPVLYKQKRVGLDGREFDLMKFRTMTTDAETRSGPVWAKADDPRVTRAGRFLRRLSLDELPQLVNVVRGDMSLVGPRPERLYFVDQFKNQVPKYLERHRVKSGMTGWAQVNGLRGNVSIEERTKYDIFYVENWSLLLDLKIIVKTVVSVIAGENSY